VDATGLALRAPTLDDVFLSLTGQPQKTKERRQVL